MAQNALANIRSKAYLSIETLMLLSCTGAFALNAASEAAAVITLYALGQFIEGVTATHAYRGLRALQNLQPKTAILVDGANRTIVSADALKVNDIIEVPAGDRIAADGVIIGGEGFVNESMLTGEHIPLHKISGNEAFAGTLSVDGTLQIRVTRNTLTNRASEIAAMVTKAISDKPQLARTIDKFSQIYTPIITIVAVIVATIPPFVFQEDFRTWLFRALTLLLIGCPCALVLATPTSVAASLTMAARHGILMKSGKTLETMSRISHIAIDKTGTLTMGEPCVQNVIPENGVSEQTLLSLAASIELLSRHPLAQAIIISAKSNNAEILNAKNVTALPGIGVKGYINETLTTVCSFDFACEHASISARLANAASLERSKGNTVVSLISGENHLGIISLSDTLRPEAEMVVNEFLSLGIETSMLTGDSQHAASGIAKKLKITMHADLSPEHKLKVLENLSATHYVAMVGDGINDAPALAKAHVGIAIGSGSHLAVETSDVALLGDSLQSLTHLYKISARAMKNIKQNIAIALVLKGGFLVFTVLGATSLWMAVAADTGASVLVTLNAIRLLRYASK